MKSKLYYIHDPMCSWCYAFKNTYDELLDNLPKDVEVINILGGLAAHSNDIMPKDMQEKIESIWYQIEEQIGTPFNHDFWKECKARRSTYLACQAVLAAKLQYSEDKMINEIQKAYYLEAKNPSDDETLIELSKRLHLDVDKFTNDLRSDDVVKLLEDDLNQRRKLKVFSFPSLVLQYKKELYPINIEYNNIDNMLKQIKDLSSNIYF